MFIRNKNVISYTLKEMNEQRAGYIAALARIRIEIDETRTYYRALFEADKVTEEIGVAMTFITQYNEEMQYELYDALLVGIDERIAVIEEHRTDDGLHDDGYVQRIRSLNTMKFLIEEGQVSEDELVRRFNLLAERFTEAIVIIQNGYFAAFGEE